MPKIYEFLKNQIGFKTDERIIVFESDDWGSVRSTSTEAVGDILNNERLNMGRNLSRYYKYDSLETSDDLKCLFEVLSAVKDSRGSYCKITPMFIVANPDFERIRSSSFSQYFYEPFIQTYFRYKGCDGSYELIKKGAAEGVFFPQFHGREHLNVTSWLNLLMENDYHTHFLFNHGMWGILRHGDSTDPGLSLQAAFNFASREEIFTQGKIIEEGLDIFEKIFGYRATCFTPPNGPLSRKLEPLLSENGIRYIQTARVLYREPVGNNTFKTRLRYLAKQNKYNQVFLIRNCFFEPSEPASFSWTDKCLEAISSAFSAGKPAIISSHRVNYSGSLSPENRASGLLQLKILLKTIVNKWPGVIFMSTEELGDYMTSKIKQ
jgi:hypothetical protein